MTLNQACYEVDWQLADDADNFDDPQEAIENDLTFQFGWPTKSRKPTLADGQEGHCGGGGPSTACPGAECRTRGGCLPMSRRTHKARVTTSFALAHLAKEVVDEDWSATTAAFRLACWSAKTWQCCTECERAYGGWRPGARMSP